MDSANYPGPPDHPKGTVNTAWERKLAAARAQRREKLAQRSSNLMVLREGDTKPPSGPQAIDQLVPAPPAAGPDDSGPRQARNLNLVAEAQEPSGPMPGQTEDVVFPVFSSTRKVDTGSEEKPLYRSDLVILWDWARPHLGRSAPYGAVFALGLAVGLGLMWGGRDLPYATTILADLPLDQVQPRPRPLLPDAPQVVAASLGPLPAAETTRAPDTASQGEEAGVILSGLAPIAMAAPSAPTVPDIRSDWTGRFPTIDAGPQRASVGIRIAAVSSLPEMQLPLSHAPGTTVTIKIGAPASVGNDTLTALGADLDAAGAKVSIARVGFAVSSSNLRFFHEADRETALDLGRASGATVRDFTDFSPKPPLGTLELYLAGN